MQTLYFEKISRFDRAAEPVAVSIPFARSMLTDPDHLLILDGETVLPAQRRVLAAWDDGSVKWLLVHFQPDLPGNLDKTLQFAIDSSGKQVSPDIAVCFCQLKTGASTTVIRHGVSHLRTGLRMRMLCVLDGDCSVDEVDSWVNSERGQRQDIEPDRIFLPGDNIAPERWAVEQVEHPS